MVDDSQAAATKSHRPQPQAKTEGVRLANLNTNSSSRRLPRFFQSVSGSLKPGATANSTGLPEGPCFKGRNSDSAKSSQGRGAETVMTTGLALRLTEYRLSDVATARLSVRSCQHSRHGHPIRNNLTHDPWHAKIWKTETPPKMAGRALSCRLKTAELATTKILDCSQRALLGAGREGGGGVASGC